MIVTLTFLLSVLFFVGESDRVIETHYHNTVCNDISTSFYVDFPTHSCQNSQKLYCLRDGKILIENFSNVNCQNDTKISTVIHEQNKCKRVSSTESLSYACPQTVNVNDFDSSRMAEFRYEGKGCQDERHYETIFLPFKDECSPKVNGANTPSKWQRDYCDNSHIANLDYDNPTCDGQPIRAHVKYNNHHCVDHGTFSSKISCVKPVLSWSYTMTDGYLMPEFEDGDVNCQGEKKGELIESTKCRQVSSAESERYNCNGKVDIYADVTCGVREISYYLDFGLGYNLDCTQRAPFGCQGTYSNGALVNQRR